ncbi:MAG: pyridoxine 5'-phosphate synthase [Candidatus Schekmanbacteria bacterium]|nr:pyridoxine 5'-phosphate synthase [Candidatus Schekmanbacteria bacterium]
MVRLGVNVDHVATLRQARKARDPDPVTAAMIAELAGADNITAHLREDRRHIQERDVRLLRELVKSSLNLELASSEDVLACACDVRPDTACLVPERREELTTEGGLDLKANRRAVERAIERLRKAGVRPGLFIDPDVAQVRAAAELGATHIELHTGAYARCRQPDDILRELGKLNAAAVQANRRGLAVHAGHGLDYRNVQAVLSTSFLEEVNIGHAIIARAIFVGIEEAVREMSAVVHDAGAPEEWSDTED